MIGPFKPIGWQLHKPMQCTVYCISMQSTWMLAPSGCNVILLL